MSTEQILAMWRMWQEAQGLSDRTIHERASTVGRLLAFSGVEALGLMPMHILAYCARPGLSGASRATYHESIRAYCAWLVKAELRTDNPALKTPSPKRVKSQPRPVQDAHVSDLVARANRARTQTYILFAALAGLRVHEIAKLHGRDFQGDILTVTGKGGKTAQMPLHPILVEEAFHYPSNEYWFHSYTGEAEHVSAHAVSKAIRDTMRRAGFVGKPHQLRHWYGTTLLAEGADLRIVQTLMRHESPATTAIYTRVDVSQQRSAMARLCLPGSDTIPPLAA
ncbi:tyrosine-type recombinase/integrase [Subtercola vilae]|uniref:Integrase n=1 Tax=Subtercola vilae TaxID=2056433 RepID=A0A4T2BV39_9MICO|nr:tyrosine-type recombinase/integrase [Subtercola vilae]TIH33666.1 hypothetical protein D4765_14380 [Subtercola vilae]